MANNFDITIDSIPGYGYTLTRTSYDLHQEINAKNIGVLKYNNEIRKKLLQRNIGKYNLLDFNEGIGYISNVYSNLESKPFSFNRNGLLGYTHIGFPGSLNMGDKLHNKQFHELINDRYDLNDGMYYYDNSSPDFDTLRWNGKFKDYTEYMNRLFSIPVTPSGLLFGLFKDGRVNLTQENANAIQSVLNDFLQYDNIKYAMEKTRIGTITPNPLRALLGDVTTKISNYIPLDTSLGLVTNQVYANMLHKGAIFNSLRKTQYITPEVYEKLGNKLNTISTIGADFRINEDTGRFPHDFSMGNGVVSLENEDVNDYFDAFGGVTQITFSDNDFTNNNDIFRAKMLNENYQSRRNDFFLRNFYPYIPFKDYQYLSFRKNTNYKNTWDDNKNDYIAYDNEINDDLLGKTELLFKQGKIDTLINRYFNTKHDENNIFETAINKNFGLSHGRNLLSKDGEAKIDSSGYENPYCRVWTYYNQYDNRNDLIRTSSIEDLQSTLINHIRTKEGLNHFKDNTVLNKNGFVNITPYSGKNNINSIKKCMFSIENLAWKDFSKDINLTKEQQGPNGGRIMWFPPYDLKFDEQVSVNWNPNEFIGRGEKIYTYTNTDRSGTLSFVLLVDNPSIVSEWTMQGEKEQDIDEQEQQLLRFFAGCEELKLKEIRGRYDYEKKTENKISINGYEFGLSEISYNEDDITFYIFFPNYYSGMDDKFDKALDYLITKYDHNIKDIIYPEYKKWKYRVDKKFLNSTGLDEYDFVDDGKYSLNIENILKLYDKNNYIQKNYSDITHSLKYFVENKNEILSGKTITNAIIESSATSDGGEKINSYLINKRMSFGEEFLKEELNYNGPITKKSGTIVKLEQYDKGNVSSLKSKLSRFVKITLKTREPNYIQTLNDRNNTNDIVNIQLGKEYEVNKTVYEMVETVNDVSPLFGGEERLYFEMLKENDSLTFNNLSQKIKYFNPAFHSITPEGFNSRLSFLHQCTRQGTTLGTSENDMEVKDTIQKSTGNLAFGRPPICVLRIGDFYNTKIVINSMTINFDDSTLDLNPEGIGVQPMFARISLNFNFLGGSDLGGPISRLQNALSFNYYANQSVYDERAIKTEYKDNKVKIKGEPWFPNKTIK